MLQKIKNWFKHPSRHEIISKELDVPFVTLVIKYDYAPLDLDNIRKLFSVNDDICAMTVLPNGNKLIAYSSGSMAIYGSNKIYECLECSVNHIIALSNEEIICSISNIFYRVNFTNNTVITVYRADGIIKYWWTIK